MVTLINKKTTIPIPEEKTADYAYLIKQVLNVPPQGGFSFEDFTACKRIDDAITSSLEKHIDNEKCADLTFEDADFADLKKRVTNMRWASRHEDLFMFMDDIINHKK